MKITVLGTAQDDGFPQWDCNCINCRLYRDGQLSYRFRSSLALKDDLGNVIIFDVSPDLKYQVESFMLKRRLHDTFLSRFPPIDAILTTHAHWGLIAGLLELSASLPFWISVYHSSYVSSLIQNSPIFKLLFEG